MYPFLTSLLYTTGREHHDSAVMQSKETQSQSDPDAAMLYVDIHQRDIAVPDMSFSGDTSFGSRFLREKQIIWLQSPSLSLQPKVPQSIRKAPVPS